MHIPETCWWAAVWMSNKIKTCEEAGCQRVGDTGFCSREVQEQAGCVCGYRNQNICGFWEVGFREKEYDGPVWDCLLSRGGCWENGGKHRARLIQLGTSNEVVTPYVNYTSNTVTENLVTSES